MAVPPTVAVSWQCSVRTRALPRQFAPPLHGVWRDRPRLMPGAGVIEHSGARHLYSGDFGARHRNHRIIRRQTTRVKQRAIRTPHRIQRIVRRPTKRRQTTRVKHRAIGRPNPASNLHIPPLAPVFSTSTRVFLLCARLSHSGNYSAHHLTPLAYSSGLPQLGCLAGAVFGACLALSQVQPHLFIILKHCMSPSTNRTSRRCAWPFPVLSGKGGSMIHSLW